MSNIFLTGAGGYIGSHVTKKLLQEGHNVIAFDNFFRGYYEPLNLISKYGNLFIKEGDLCNLNNLEKIFQEQKIDVVMHFAALCLVNESMQKPDIYFKNNVLGTLNLLEVMKNYNITKIIFSSTCAVYGDTKYLPIDEQHPTNPKNPYGESKLISEKFIQWFGKIYNFKYIIFRYFNVFGADDQGEIGDSKKPSELLIQNAVRGALGIEPFFLTCPIVDTKDGTPIRDYVDILDLTDAHIKGLDYLQQNKKNVILNLGNNKGSSVKEIVNVVKKELGVDFLINRDIFHTRDVEDKELCASIKKAKEILNWQPSRTLQDGILSLKKWYENKPQGYKK